MIALFCVFFSFCFFLLLFIDRFSKYSEQVACITFLSSVWQAKNGNLMVSRRLTTDQCAQTLSNRRRNMPRFALGWGVNFCRGLRNTWTFLLGYGRCHGFEQNSLFVYRRDPMTLT
eukprot:TRINITY_DN4715_c0_g1_i3.p2 TRINITY_DN4715_c0_g1~~TRINITY_DN4715_c0_g1_i3.p2  ORF type:complete len:116 (+),score=7.45 TRINITY_DN4715_c0_g1_i3:551-898(+)